MRMSQNIKYYLLGVLILLFFNSSNVEAQNNYVKTVVIDAGHGGKDPGASGKNNYEKDIALAIALKTGNYIKKNLPDVKVIYTRSTDKFIKLRNRAKIANDADADLFISIHCDGFNNPKVRGSSTYVMGLHKSAANLKVAQKENSAILLEEDYEDHYGGFDPKSLEGYIALAMSQTGFRDNSIVFAKDVQDQMRERVGMKDRSVKEAGFMVLYMTAMPGVLVETGFITNPKEEKFLGSKDGQMYIASAIYRAVKAYKTKVEKTNAAKHKDIIKVVKDKIKAEKAVEKIEEKIDTTKIEISTTEKPKQESKQQTKVKAIDTEKTDNKKDVVSTKKETPKQEKPSTKKEVNIGDVYFAVQIKSHSKKIRVNHPSFKGRKDVFEYKHNGYYKYAAGKTSSYLEAYNLMKKLRRSTFKDAFIIAFNKKERIPAEKARELLKKK